ncbi:calcium-binding protein [Nostoc sp. 'Lobaria pulmonaria (5183) cyanobiont']|uniref:calcium-binding protein n=1 Tax=Nostoc sp. 'Lobaria pulmonaria (5183) cyanobiont' TaxID=1618022 RepID=UPI00131A467D|nr:calcium-binding protein [Nostoc sp. 'Lobaria pulmonaria (5183) cyanobiont']
MTNFIVNQATDNGTGNTKGSLSYAIRQANQLAGNDTITIDSDVRVTSVPKTLVNSNITIVGNNHKISGDANNNGINDNGDVRPLFILSGSVDISNLTITNGRSQGGDSSIGGAGAGLGGGLFIYDGNVSLTNVAFSKNTAQGGNHGNVYSGYGSGLGGFGGGYGFDGSFGSFGSFGVGGLKVIGGDGGDGGFGGGGGYSYYGGGDGSFGGDGGFGGGGSGGGGGNYGHSSPGDGAFGGGNGGYYKNAGGGGAGLGGGIFVRSGSLTLSKTSFTNNTATGGTASESNSGLGLGGGIFIIQSLTNTNGNNQGMPTVLPTVTAVNNPTFSGNRAANDAGTSTNNDNVYGTITPLNLTGTPNADVLTGTARNNIINGLAGNDILVGGAGNDTLIGGAGADRFLYNTNAPFVLTAIGVDTISDFKHCQADKIVLDKTTFNTLASIPGTGFSNASDFKITSSAATSTAKIVYDAVSGQLFYNPNGSAAGFGSGGQFATLTGAPTLTATDFIVQV